MNSFYQRLKEIDRTAFELLCFHLLTECFPAGDIKRVEGESGDDGVDTFTGSLTSGPTVWQAKAFSNGIGESQKGQIRASLKQALTKLKPKRWVLCLNVEMDMKTHRWWERFVQSHSSKARIEVLSASAIVREMIHRRSLSERFFPGAAIDASELRSLCMKTSSMSDSQLSELAQETSEQMIERLKRRDARFNYQLVVSPENSPVASPPGSTFSITMGRTTVNAFPRDVGALKLDPPSVSIKFSGAGAEKMQEFIETGCPQVFDRGDLVRLSTTLPFLELENSQTMSVALTACKRKETWAVRASFGKANEKVVYDYLPFREERQGKKELEIVYDGETTEPFTISAVIRENGRSVELEEREQGFTVRSADKWIHALRALGLDNHFELLDLASGQKLVSGKLFLDPNPGSLSRFAEFFRDATEVSDYFSVELIFRLPITKDDLLNFHFLRQLMVDGAVQLGPITGRSVIRGEAENDPECIWKGEPLQLRLDHTGYPVSLLGAIVHTGPFSLAVDVRLHDPEATHSQWIVAPNGSQILMRWDPIGPARITKHLEGTPRPIEAERY